MSSTSVTRHTMPSAQPLPVHSKTTYLDLKTGNVARHVTKLGSTAIKIKKERDEKMPTSQPVNMMSSTSASLAGGYGYVQNQPGVYKPPF